MKAQSFIGLLGIALGILVAGPSLPAHHSFAAEFDANKPISLKGKLVKLEWINPHGWLHMEVNGADGKTEVWAVESGAPNSLLRRGLRKTDFPIGSEISVEGYRAKDGSNTANGVMVKFADGRDFFMGSSGTGAPEQKPTTR